MKRFFIFVGVFISVLCIIYSLEDYFSQNIYDILRLQMENLSISNIMMR